MAITENEGLSSRQLLLIPYLLSEASIEAACRKARVSRPTAYAWLRDGAFREELQRRREDLYKETIETLKTAGNKAVKKLIRLIDSRNPAIALRASTQVLFAAVKAKEWENVSKPPLGDSSLEALREAWKLVEIDSSGKVTLLEKSETDI